MRPGYGQRSATGAQPLWARTSRSTACTVFGPRSARGLRIFRALRERPPESVELFDSSIAYTHSHAAVGKKRASLCHRPFSWCAEHEGPLRGRRRQAAILFHLAVARLIALTGAEALKPPSRGHLDPTARVGGPLRRCSGSSVFPPGTISPPVEVPAVTALLPIPWPEKCAVRDQAAL